MDRYVYFTPMEMKFKNYFLKNRPQLPLESFFMQLEEKVERYENNIGSAKSLFIKENKEFIDGITAEYDKDIVKAYNDHTRFFYEAEGTVEEKHIEAERKTGEKEIQGYYDYQVALAGEHIHEMFDYFNKSSLVILYALIESELKKLCNLLKDHEQQRLSVDDLDSKDYIKASFKYLELVIGLSVNSLEPIIGKIQHIQYIRNRIVHNGAEFNYEKNDALDQVVNALNELVVLQEAEPGKRRALKLYKTELVMQGYLLLRDLFIEMLWKIDGKSGYPILTDRLNILFQNPPTNGSIKIIEVKSVKGGKQIKTEVQSAKGFNYQCTIFMTAGKMNKTEVINQVEDNDALKKILDEPPNILHWRIDAVFEAFRYHNPAINYKLMFF